ncbi:hypothetical protein Dimus_024474 [Dionaea muscipula]
MATSWSSSSLDIAASGNVIRCRCNEVAAMFTSKTRDNPFRRFVKCRRRQGLGCGMWEWIDADLPLTAKMGIVKQMDQIDNLKKDLQKKEECTILMVAKHATDLIEMEARLKFLYTVLLIMTVVIIALVITITVG